jgi:hypothetical protein
MDDLIDRIARTVLYEGFVLYPYRPSVKNQQRWTFGGLYPKSYCEAQNGADACSMQTQCLVQGNADTTIRATIRFLHLVERRIGRLDLPLSVWPQTGEPAYQVVDSMQVGTQRYEPWEEAVEQTIALDETTLGGLAKQTRRQAIYFSSSRKVEPVPDQEGTFVGMIIRERHPLEASLCWQADLLSDDLYRVTLQVQNQSHLEESHQDDRNQAVLRSLVSTHGVLSLGGGGFVSLLDPPDELQAVAAECQNIGAWPVLVGEAPDRRTILAAPIILYDYPQIAPESQGDLYDATEIDEILTLRIMTLTADEKEAMAALDDKTRRLLERTESLQPAQLSAMHGGMRDSTRASDHGPIMPWNPFDERPGPESVLVAGVALRPGDQVRLRPRGRTDIFDTALAGMTARIESIEQDFEDRIHLAVVVNDDPGSDLGLKRLPAHRFFFSPEEVEPI